MPPAADRRDGELRGVGVDADADPSLIQSQVIDAIGVDLACSEKGSRSGIMPATECLAWKLARSAHAIGPASACSFSSLAGAARKRRMGN
jgi:hypothetical protein